MLFSRVEVRGAGSICIRREGSPMLGDFSRSDPRCFLESTILYCFQLLDPLSNLPRNSHLPNEHQTSYWGKFYQFLRRENMFTTRDGWVEWCLLTGRFAERVSRDEREESQMIVLFISSASSLSKSLGRQKNLDQGLYDIILAICLRLVTVRINWQG